MKGECDGQTADLVREDLNTWRGPARTCTNLAFHYSVYAEAEGPFDSILDGNHAFLNLAMVLFYMPHERQCPARVSFRVPPSWKLATLLGGTGDEFEAPNYDTLVDSPVEAGHFAEFNYPQDYTRPGAAVAEARHATIRLVIDADPSDYSADRILSSFQKITSEEVKLMQDLPFQRYTFILHFLRGGGSTGGMEHRNGTAIALPAGEIRNNLDYLENVAAHEFFHAWNVKRIRPQSLEPIDYINGNDTRDLWLCEGVTNTYAQLVLLRAGLINRDTFYARVAGAIEALQDRSARRFQSVETSGREAWLEKYSDYNRSNRSISYYNKGELLGYLLDLGLRHASQNQTGLDDLMRRLNQEFGRSGRLYTLADLCAIVGQIAPAFDVDRFFTNYLRGTQELDYSAYFGYAGVQVATQITELPLPGFSASRNTGGVWQVDSVDSGSDAERAGLQPGDVVIRVDGELLSGSPISTLPLWRPRQAVELQISRGDGTHVIKLRIGVNQQLSTQLMEEPEAAPSQMRVREGWLTGVSNSSTGKP
jgi:predicted metalloprotease with PDZ domain